MASIDWNSVGMNELESVGTHSMDELMSKKRKRTNAKQRFRNRSRLEIVSNLLTRAKSGALKTHLMYGANLSYPMLGEYLSILLRSELIGEERYENDVLIHYRTTSKGLEFLNLYQSIREMFGDQYLGLTGSSGQSEQIFAKGSWEPAAPEMRVS